MRRPKRRTTVETVGRLYATLNRRYWNGRLPTPRLVLIPAGQAGAIVDASCDWGGCMEQPDGSYLIELREVDWHVHLGFLRLNLLHEMIHVEIGTRFDHRSREWRAAVRRLSRLGALREAI